MFKVTLNIVGIWRWYWEYWLTNNWQRKRVLPGKERGCKLNRASPQNDALILIQSNYTASFLPSKNCFNSSRASIAGQHQGWHREPRAPRTALYFSGSLPKENRITRWQTWMEKILLDSKVFFSVRELKPLGVWF